MLSQYDVIRYTKKNPDKSWFIIDDDKNVIDKEDGKVICSLETLTQFMRQKMHCDFDCVYHCHASLQTTLRCRECGTVIFSYDDERYDPLLCCPTCGGYETHLKYWTKKEIDEDIEKQKTISWLEQMTKEENEAYERYKRRNGKYDSEIWKGRIRGKKHGIRFELKCDNLFKSGLKGLYLEIIWMNRDENGCFVYHKWWKIPLSIWYLKTMIRIRKMNKEEC